MASFGDPAEALKWAHHYGIKREYWPYNVRMLSDNPDCDRHQQQAEENWDQEFESQVVEYLKYPLPLESIVLIDSPVAFESFLDSGLTVSGEIFFLL